MNEYAVETFDLTKTFEVAKKEKGGLLKRLTLRKEKKTIVAVDCLNLKIPRGEIFGLLGPNGAGKTTTIKMLSSLLLPNSGRASVNGFDVIDSSEKVRGSIGVLMMGERSVYWKLTGYENLEYFSTLHYIPPAIWKERIPRLIDLVGLSDRQNDIVETYSSGMKQRLALARCLINDPPILMLDEPTIGLDPGAARSIRELMMEMKHQGKTIQLTTHYMEEADQLCDRVGIIHEGTIIALDTPSNLKAKLKARDIVEIEASNISDEMIPAMEGIPGIDEVKFTMTDPVISSGIMRVSTLDSRSVLPSLLSFLGEKSVNVTNVKVSEPKLEDVFIQLTGRTLR
jgi:ABC-2 type transport system ATP-binding protein